MLRLLCYVCYITGWRHPFLCFRPHILCVAQESSNTTHSPLSLPRIPSTSGFYFCIFFLKWYSDINHHLLPNCMSYVAFSRSLGVSRMLCLTPNPKSRGFGMGFGAYFSTATNGDRQWWPYTVPPSCFPHFPLFSFFAWQQVAIFRCKYLEFHRQLLI